MSGESDAVDPLAPTRPDGTPDPAAAVHRDGTPAVEPPTQDVEAAADAASLPGAHRGGFQRLPTAPVETASTVASTAPGFEPTTWPENPEEAPARGLAGTALAFAIAGLLASFFVGWGFPVGIAAIVVAVVALRRPIESRVVAGWAMALGILSVVYSAGWLIWAATRA